MKSLAVRAVALALVVGAIIPTTASAHRNGLRHNYLHTYYKAERRFGSRAVGRDLVHIGIASSGAQTIPASKHAIATAIRQLRKLLHPVPFYPYLLPKVVGKPKWPAGIRSLGWKSNMPACTWVGESGGKPTVLNTSGSSASGWYQILRSTWLAAGGGRFASEARWAAKKWQDYIAAKIAVTWGIHNQWVNC